MCSLPDLHICFFPLCLCTLRTDDSYDRFLWPPNTTCVSGKPDGKAGTEVVYDESIDKNQDALDGGVYQLA